jgi:hypothetical protein
MSRFDPSDYGKIKELLTSDYGRPVIDTVYWLSGLDRNVPSNWREALSAGERIYKTRCETLTTNIVMALYSEDSRIRFQVQYHDFAYDE